MGKETIVTQTTLRPGQKGTKGLTNKYGDRLVCVRYKYDQSTGRRYTTVELIEEETTPQSVPKAKPTPQPPSPTQRLGIRVEYWETELRGQVKAAGGLWRPRHQVWEIPYEEVVKLGLEGRVVGNVFQPSGETVGPSQ